MNKKGSNGALKRTNTPKSPDVKPAKNPKINANVIAMIKNSFSRIFAMANMKPERKNNEKVRIKNIKVSSALIKMNKLPASHK